VRRFTAKTNIHFKHWEENLIGEKQLVAHNSL
jgi:hypothetical protein